MTSKVRRHSSTPPCSNPQHLCCINPQLRHYGCLIFLRYHSSHQGTKHPSSLEQRAAVRLPLRDHTRHACHSAFRRHSFRPTRLRPCLPLPLHDSDAVTIAVQLNNGIRFHPRRDARGADVARGRWLPVVESRAARVQPAVAPGSRRRAGQGTGRVRGEQGRKKRNLSLLLIIQCRAGVESNR